jgi:hypothetical protein
MSLLQRTIKLEAEALAHSDAIRQQWEAFWEWLRGLPRKEALAFTEFSLPTFVELGMAPPYRILPSQMSVKERQEYADDWQKKSAELKRQSGRDLMAEHRAVIDLWRRFVQRPTGKLMPGDAR